MTRNAGALGAASRRWRPTALPPVRSPVPVRSGSPLTPTLALPRSVQAQSVGVKPKACEAVQPQSQLTSGAKAPRYLGESKKLSDGAQPTLSSASFAGRGSRKTTGSIDLPPRVTSGPRVTVVTGASASAKPGIRMLLLAASKTPRFVASL